MHLMFERGLPSTGKNGWVCDTRDDVVLLDEPSDEEDVIDEGKWMLFYPKSDMDKRWLEACEHLHFGEFGVVNMIQASTFGRNQTHANGVIVFYIDRAKTDIVLETGRHIMNAMRYQDTMFYKTNQQSREKCPPRKYTLQIQPEYECPFDNVTILHS
jgi:hypothetical protein